MRARTRVHLFVGVAAVAAAGIVVGVVLASSRPAQPRVQCKQAPPALVVPGVRSGAAGAVRAAMAAWPDGTLSRLEALARQHPKDPVVQFNYGTALLCAGYVPDAVTALRAAKSAGRDTTYEVDADTLLHPQFFQNGYPLFEPSGPATGPLLVRGMAAQRAGHQHTAERLFAEAARRSPGDADAATAAAVALFDEDNLLKAFSHLGPLVTRFPRAQVVRFHLGLLLTWTGQRDQAVVELRKTVALGRSTRLGKQAAALLAGIERAGSEQGSK